MPGAADYVRRAGEAGVGGTCTGAARPHLTVRQCRGRPFAQHDSDSRGPSDYTSIINDRHAQRLKGVLDDARAKGATVTACVDTGNARRMPLRLKRMLGPEPNQLLPALGADCSDCSTWSRLKLPGF